MDGDKQPRDSISCNFLPPEKLYPYFKEISEKSSPFLKISMGSVIFRCDFRYVSESGALIGRLRSHVQDTVHA